MGMLMSNLSSLKNDMEPVKKIDGRQHKQITKPKNQEMWVPGLGFLQRDLEGNLLSAGMLAFLICMRKTLVNICESECFKHGFPLRTFKMRSYRHTKGMRLCVCMHTCNHPQHGTCYLAGFTSSIWVMILAAFSLETGWRQTTMVLP